MQNHFDYFVLEKWKKNKQNKYKQVIEKVDIKLYKSNFFTYQNCTECIVDTEDGNCEWHLSLYLSGS